MDNKKSIINDTSSLNGNLKNHNSAEKTSFSDSYGADGEKYHSNKYIRFFQKKVAPYKTYIRKIKFNTMDNSKWIRLFAFFGCIFLMLSSVVLAQIYTKGYVINPTPIGKSRRFLNGDTATINNVSYDKQSHIAMLNLSTKSNIGINSNDLKADFVLLSSGGEQKSQLTIIPTYSDNYTIIIKDLNPGFKAMKLILQNNRDTDIDEFAKAINSGSNDDANIPMSNKGVKTVVEYNKDNSKANNGTGLQGDIDTNDGIKYKDAIKLLPILKQNNKTNFTLNEKDILKHPGNIKGSTKPVDIMKNGLNKAIVNVRTDMNVQKGLISNNNKSIVRIKKKISLLKQDQLNVQKNKQIDNLKQNILDYKSNNEELVVKISKDKDWLNKYENQLNLINKGEITFSNPSKPKNANLFN